MGANKGSWAQCRVNSVWWLLLVCASCASCAACSAPRRYLLEQAWGQLRVLHGRQRISELLDRPTGLDQKQRTMLQIALLVRRYAHEELGLSQSAAYTRYYDTGGRPLAHNLSACPKDRLEPVIWRFPLVGGLPYIGFFDRERGLQVKQELEAQGLDTHYRPVSAYSSLGWLADPVYSPMLTDDVGRLVELIIHETTHTTIFLRNQVAFNESLATFVGNLGALSFLARLYGPYSSQVARFRAQMAQELRFSRLVARLYDRLDRLYRSPLPVAEKLARREKLFAWAKKRYREIYPDPETWGSFGRRPLNNAVVLSHGRYKQGLGFHGLVYRAVGRDLRRLVALYRHAQHFDDPIGHVARVCGLSWYVRQRM